MTSSSTATTINNYRHAFIKDLIISNDNPDSSHVSPPFLANSRQTVRVMATITSIEDLIKTQEDLGWLQLLCPSLRGFDNDKASTGEDVRRSGDSDYHHQQQQQQHQHSMKSITLDDGTGSIGGICCSQHFLVTRHRLKCKRDQKERDSDDSNGNNFDGEDDDEGVGAERSDENHDDDDNVGRLGDEKDNNLHILPVGTTVDCILKLRQSSSIKRWFVDCVMVVVDVDDNDDNKLQLVDEPLRWMTVSLLQEQQQQQQRDNDASTSNTVKVDCSCGFPTHRQDTCEEVYRMIYVQSKIYNSRHDNNNLSNNDKQRTTNAVGFNSKKRKSLLTNPAASASLGPTRVTNKTRRVSNLFPSGSNTNTNSIVNNVTELPTSFDNQQQQQPISAHSNAKDDELKKVQENGTDTGVVTVNESRKLPQSQPQPPQPPAQTHGCAPPPTTTVPQQLVGVSFDDLQLVLQISSSKLQGFIEDLQLQGQIYQNEKQEFLPLWNINRQFFSFWLDLSCTVTRWYYKPQFSSIRSASAVEWHVRPVMALRYNQRLQQSQIRVLVLTSAIHTYKNF